MKDETIRKLAEQAGFRIIPQAAPEVYRVYTSSASGRCEDSLARFAALVAEQCASLAEETPEGMGQLGRNSADAIRAAFPMPKD